jgi:hypothetical protein
MIRVAAVLLAYACVLARHIARHAQRHWRERDCWHPELRYHSSARWIFRCDRCGRPLNTRPMGATVHEQ